MKCLIHDTNMECLGGENAHRANWYCPVCKELEQLRAENEKLKELLEAAAMFIPDAEMNDIKYAKIPLLNLNPEITNKMKSDCMGEVVFEKESICSACHYDAPDNDCEVCGGEVHYQESITVPWDTMKDIYKLMAKSVMKVEK